MLTEADIRAAMMKIREADADLSKPLTLVLPSVLREKIEAQSWWPEAVRNIPEAHGRPVEVVWSKRAGEGEA